MCLHVCPPGLLVIASTTPCIRGFIRCVYILKFHGHVHVHISVSTVLASTFSFKVKWRPLSEHILGSVDYQGTLQLWDNRSSAPLGSVPAHKGKAFCLAWSQQEAGEVAEGGEDCWRVYSGGSDGVLHAASTVQ